MSLKKYKATLEEMINGPESSTPFLNSDRGHNAVVMQVILDKAAHIKMFCGELSIFRKEFKDKVEASYPIDNEGQEIMDGLKCALDKFLRDGKKLEIIMEHPFLDLFYADEIYKNTLREYSIKGNIELYRIKNGEQSVKMGVARNHFTVADNKMYRQEIKADRHEAICCLNNTTNAEILSNYFDSLKHLLAEPIPLT